MPVWLAFADRSMGIPGSLPRDPSAGCLTGRPGAVDEAFPRSEEQSKCTLPAAAASAAGSQAHTTELADVCTGRAQPYRRHLVYKSSAVDV